MARPPSRALTVQQHGVPDVHEGGVDHRPARHQVVEVHRGHDLVAKLRLVWVDVLDAMVLVQLDVLKRAILNYVAAVGVPGAALAAGVKRATITAFPRHVLDVISGEQIVVRAADGVILVLLGVALLRQR